MFPRAHEYVFLHPHVPRLAVSLIEIANTTEHPHTPLQIYANSIAVTSVGEGLTPFSSNSEPSESREVQKSVEMNDSGVLCMRVSHS
jgi:hypothetical protein